MFAKPDMVSWMKCLELLLQGPCWYLYCVTGDKSNWTSIRIVNIIICVVSYTHTDINSWKNWMFLKTAAIKFPLLTTTQCWHTHTHHKTTWCTLPHQNLFQTVPQAAYKMHHNIKVNFVYSINLKCKKFLKTQRKIKLNIKLSNCVTSI